MAQHYPNVSVAANDVGVIALRANGKITDLIGLGSTDVLDLLRTRGLDDPALDALLARNGVKIAMGYPSVLGPRITEKWRRVASWTLGKPRITPFQSTVVFYTPDDQTYAEALQKLKAFRSQLPAGVKVEYTEP